MARKPNYQMERMDRDRAKALKTAAKDAARQAERERSSADAAASGEPRREEH